MDDESKLQGMVKWGLGALGLGAVAAALTVPEIGIWVGLGILLLGLLLFGGYILWQRAAARRKRERFTSAIESQTAAAPKAISDPNKRAALDKLRQKFQKGLQEFKTRGKDIYKLPWYVIIGEPGSGKTEAIRHSGIDFPPGLQDELQGSGGTVNMDWWFTNRSIILDTAGSMIFNEASAGEAPEWREFLRLLKKARPHSPVNGLFLVLSVESLIKDSADRIAQKASRLAQQLDLIQRTLDVRFPVYLLVTKCDLLTGFREYFDSISDPLLQHQMFGWSNPDPLDSHFRPDLVDKHLETVADKLRRRRMALLRETPGDSGRMGDTAQFFASSYQLGRATGTSRRLDEVDAMFALPESIMRLAPRLRRYLETIFVAGEWSAKPVFLRGIYFTSSMREGKALDEAIAFATGMTLDQLPEDRTWDKNRAFFLRDLFHEKVFREAGLVTRATNTLQMLRKRQFLIFGSAGAALLLLLVFAGLAYRNLKDSVGRESAYWKAGAANLKQGEWSPPIVRNGATPSAPFIYAGGEPVPGLGDVTVLEYHRRLRAMVDKPLDVGFIFKPVSWARGGGDEGRREAQRTLFEAGVLRPLLARTRDRLLQRDPVPGNPASLDRHREALLTLIHVEADALRGPAGGVQAERYLQSLLSYLMETNAPVDTNLAQIFTWAYDPRRGSKAGTWPPPSLLLGNSLASNAPISEGLNRFQAASVITRTNVDLELSYLTNFNDSLRAYHVKELVWLTNSAGTCDDLAQNRAEVATAWEKLSAAAAKTPGQPLINLSTRYAYLDGAATKASALALSEPIKELRRSLPEARQTSGLIVDLIDRLGELASQAAAHVRTSFEGRRSFVTLLDNNCFARTNVATRPAYEVRWDLYSNACALAAQEVKPTDASIGEGWTRYLALNRMAERTITNTAAYQGPLAVETSNACTRIAAAAQQKLRSDYVDQYVSLVARKFNDLTRASWTGQDITNVSSLFIAVANDIAAGDKLADQQFKLEGLPRLMGDKKQEVLRSVHASLFTGLGFPVALNAAVSIPVQAVGGLRKRVESVRGALQNPLWLQDTGPAMKDLQLGCDRLSALLGALVKDDGTPAEFELFFVPDQANRTMISIFRGVEARIGGTTAGSIADLSRLDVEDPGCRLGKFPLNADLSLAFRDLTSSQQAAEKFREGEWAVLRLIRDGKAEPAQEGKHWRFKVHLTKDANQGDVMFEARLPQAFPRKTEWPQAR